MAQSLADDQKSKQPEWKLDHSDDGCLVVRIPVRFRRRNGRHRVLAGEEDERKKTRGLPQRRGVGDLQCRGDAVEQCRTPLECKGLTKQEKIFEIGRAVQVDVASGEGPSAADAVPAETFRMTTPEPRRNLDEPPGSSRNEEYLTKPCDLAGKFTYQERTTGFHEI